MSVLVENLTKIYGSQKALDNISFEVKPGEILGFLGPNGAGKSTTMKILTGYLTQSSGIARVCDINVDSESIELRKNIGYLPELNPLYSDMYVKEYLLFTAGILGLGKNSNSAAEEMIIKTGLSVERKKKIGQLSKGYKQRVGLAAAMIHNPKVLILDEPTSGLDPNQVTEIRKLIHDIGIDKTVILSTHIMREVEAMCSRVVIINNGEIVADDSIQNLQKHISKEFIINVEFKSEPNIDILSSMKEVKSLTRLGNTYKIISSSDIREELAIKANAESWLILSMNLQENKLEEVFKTLTLPK